MKLDIGVSVDALMALGGASIQPPLGEQFKTITDANGVEQPVTVTDINGVEQRITVSAGPS